MYPMWENWQPGRVAYRVRYRAERAHAVERKGPKGGVKTIAVYDAHSTATYVANALNISREDEL